VQETFITIYPYILTLATGYLGYQLQSLNKSNKELKRQNKEKMKATDDGICCLLRVKMIEYHDRYVKEESISSHGLENFILMYKSYHALGGNGMIDKMHDDIKSLKIK